MNEKHTDGVLRAALHPENRGRSESRGSWIQTFRGGQFWPLDPRAEDVDIEDIAHALSLQCRFSGHTVSHYSVAQHSIHVAELVPAEDMLWALLHDAPEAYLVDLPKPLKDSGAMDAYLLAEGRCMEAVAEAFGLDGPMPASVKAADAAMLHAEARDLLYPCEQSWLDRGVADPRPVHPMAPQEAERAFLMAFRSLTSERAA